MLYYMVLKFFFLIVFLLLIILVFFSSRIKKKKIFVFNFVLLFIALTSIVIFLNFSNRNTDTVYNPPVFDGEKIKPGFFSEKN